MNRSLTKLVLALGLFVSARAEITGPFWFTSPRDWVTWRLMFPAPFPSAGEMYRDAVTALDVREVKSDGRRVEPEIGLRVGVPSRLTIKSEGGNLVYECPPDSVDCWVDPTGNHPSGYNVKLFKLPPEFNLLEIIYRIRYPDGSFSKELKVNFVKGTDVIKAPSEPRKPTKAR